MAVYKFSELTGKIIGCAMKVHRYFGPGFPEVIYKRALLIELGRAGIDCEAEVEQDIYYEEELIGKRRIDILAEQKVLVELKAISETDEASVNQVTNCLRVFRLEVGLLLNFGMTSLYYRRFVR